MRLVRTGIPVLAGLCLLVFLAQTLGKADRPHGNDFTSYLLSARALLEGTDPYATQTPFPYLYPLFLAAVLVPWTFLPAMVAQGLWFLCGAAALFVSLRACARVSEFRREDALLPVSVLFLMFASPVQNTFLNGQVNLIVLCLLVFFASAMARHRDMAAGFWLSLAVVIKPYPAILLPALVLHRRWAAAGTAAGLTAVWFVLPALLFDQFPGAFGSYVARVLSPTLSGAESHSGMFFSPAGFAGFLVPAFRDSGILRLASAGLIGAALLAMEIRRGFRWDARTFALYLVAMLLLSPMPETHHLVFLVPGVGIVLFRAWRQPDWRRGWRGFGTAAFLVPFLLGTGDKKGPWIFLALVILFVLLSREDTDRDEHRALGERPAVRPGVVDSPMKC